MTDEITPYGFDWLLIVLSIPILALVFYLSGTRIRRYRRQRGTDRRKEAAAEMLAAVYQSFALLAVAVAFLVRPIADLAPVLLTNLERWVAPGSRFIVLVVVVVLIWEERKRYGR